jgi:hypothetical protein
MVLAVRADPTTTHRCAHDWVTGFLLAMCMSDFKIPSGLSGAKQLNTSVLI